MTRTWLLATFGMLFLISAAHAQVPSVRIAGRALDRAGFALPGVTVNVSGAITRQAVTDADGKYVFTDLAPGAYTLTAILPGFVAASRNVVAAAPGSFAVDFSLYLGCLSEIQLVVQGPPLPITIAAVDAVLYVRVADAGRPVRLADGDCVEGREHQATVLAIVKSPRLNSDTIRLVQEAVTARARGRAAYGAGDELIVFLQRHQSGAFVDFSHDVYAVRDGRVRWTRDDLPGVTDGSPVRQVLEGLRNTLSMIR
jgi:hypothetical protein